MIICPVCKKILDKEGKTYNCENKQCFIERKKG